MREMERKVFKYDEDANLAGHCPAIWKVSKPVRPWELPREHRAREIAAEPCHKCVVYHALNSGSPHQIPPSFFVNLPRPRLVFFDLVLLKDLKFISIDEPEYQVHQYNQRRSHHNNISEEELAKCEFESLWQQIAFSRFALWNSLDTESLDFTVVEVWHQTVFKHRPEIPSENG